VLCERWVENLYYQYFLRGRVLPAPAGVWPLVPVALAIKRELRRRCAVEPVIGPSQSRAPHGPQLSLIPSRRCRQRRPRRRRLQFPPPDPLAQDFVVPNHRSHRRASARSSLKSAFFTEECFRSLECLFANRKTSVTRAAAKPDLEVSSRPIEPDASI
jgi:hypothetical protein